MKIAYVIPMECVISGDSNGIKMQAKIWAESLKEMGHDVSYIDPWQHYKWNDYDIIHIFSSGLWLHKFIPRIRKQNTNIVLSPIIDSINSTTLYKLASYCGIPQLRLFSSNYVLRESIPYIKKFYSRSQHESDYLIKSYGIDKKLIEKIPLSCRFDKTNNTVKKERFCFHVSSITQPRKNVGRLIMAANKYGFKLVLAGNKGTTEEFTYINNLIKGNPNVEVLGFISQEKLIEMYNKAKVFALPSINEGVGLVALEAAVKGCDIVITNIGGPKEYYGDLAYQVNPYNIDEIGKAVINALESTKQPELSKHILEEYSLEKLTERLLESYISIL